VAEPRAPVLVIGVGSELRRDDAAGRRVAEAVSTRALPDVEVRSVHQLTPELAEELAGRRTVVIVDASVDVDEIAAVPLDPVSSAPALTHHLDPAALTALAGRFGWAPTAAVAVHLPVHDLRLGEELSPPTAAAVEQAVDVVVELIGTSV
jgi:hydrogenase maturation protease